MIEHDLFGKPVPTFRDHALGRIFQAERAGIVVIGEHFGVAAPADHRPQRQLGVLGAHVVFELVEEAALGCRVVDAFLQDMANMRGKRQKNCSPILPPDLGDPGRERRSSRILKWNAQVILGTGNTELMENPRQSEGQVLGGWMNLGGASRRSLAFIQWLSAGGRTSNRHWKGRNSASFPKSRALAAVITVIPGAQRPLRSAHR